MKEKNAYILHIGSTESTNKIALSLDMADHLFTVVADRQTNGRGRLGRSFYSEGGLYMSVVLMPNKINCSPEMCTAAAGLAVKEALDNLGVCTTRIKWVNDILLNGKKICGILTEATSSDNKIERIVVGIGINLTTPKNGFPDDIKEKAGDIGFTGDKMALAKDVLQRLDRYTSLANRDISNLYNKNLAFIGCDITVQNYVKKDETASGKILGVDDNCNLILETKNGDILHICSGEICDN